jgi:hypothetical protein
MSIFDNALRLCAMARGKGCTTAAVLGANAVRTFYPVSPKLNTWEPIPSTMAPQRPVTIVVMDRRALGNLPRDGGPFVDPSVMAVRIGDDPGPRLYGPIIFDTDAVRELATQGRAAAADVVRLRREADLLRADLNAVRMQRDHYHGQAEKLLCIVDALTEIIEPTLPPTLDPCVNTPDRCTVAP